MTNPNIKEFDPPIEKRIDDLLKLTAIVNQFIDVKRATVRRGRHETDGEHTLHPEEYPDVIAIREEPLLRVAIAAYSPV